MQEESVSPVLETLRDQSWPAFNAEPTWDGRRMAIEIHLCLPSDGRERQR